MKNKKDYKSILSKNDLTQNLLALNILLDYGRINLLDENYFVTKKEEIEETDGIAKGDFILSKDYKMRILEISRDMAQLKPNDLYQFIQNELNISNDKEHENLEDKETPNYDY